MNIKKLTTVILFCMMPFILMACSSPKNTFIEGYKSFKDVKVYETESSVDIDVTYDGEIKPQVNQMISSINDSKLFVTQKIDKNDEKIETVLDLSLKFSSLSFEINLPFLIDDKNNKFYLKTNNLIENFGGLFPHSILSELNNKLLEFDLSETNALYEDEVFISYIQSNEFQKDINTEIQALLVSKSKEDFVKDDNGKISVSFTTEEINKLIENVSLIVVSKSAESESSEQIHEILDLFKNSLNMHSLVIESSFDDNGTLMNDKITLNLSISYSGENANVKLTLDNIYKKLNGEIEFSIDPSREDTLNQKELGILLDKYNKQVEKNSNTDLEKQCVENGGTWEEELSYCFW